MAKKSLEVEGMNPLINPEQLAALLGIGTEQVRKLTRDDLIPHHRVGGLLRYDYEAVKAATRQGSEHIEDEAAAWVEVYYGKVLDRWGAEGAKGNDYMIAHFDGVTALARDMKSITVAQCEDYRRRLRATTGWRA